MTSITYSGTGTPGTNIYLAVDCVDPGHPDDCSSAEEYGQAYLNNPIVVGTDGQWSYQATYAGTPNPVPEQIVMASSALVDAQGNTLRDSTGALIQSGHSEQITFYVG
ncbi:hypothetical protein AX769_05755 [Frondihabitans sp. PAMC 28766]|uniref:hypothetical protein n=1 Tax=Frondihabitans sp. PAMC 28766 TaxID=1795630 RepID=UPI00078E2B8F|nr:hypothetical protein [Frondihabitans sp. PAMC 28766]AMM19742.1 hypothetical protein AX769_05755 [Frondihabitans sp. PAMC 28766]